MAKTSLAELKYEDCQAGGKFYAARDPKYRGFLYLRDDNESLEKVLKEFDSFKRAVDDANL